MTIGKDFMAKRRSGRLREPAWLPAAILFVIAGAYLVLTSPSGMAGVPHFRVCGKWKLRNCVVDGDTIRYGGVKIRLADIDAPEALSPKCDAEAALGKRAALRLVELVNAGPFKLVRAGDRDEDSDGRKLRVVERDGHSLADALVTEGLARPWDGGRRSWCG